MSASGPSGGLADVGCPASINGVADIKRALIRCASTGYEYTLKHRFGRAGKATGSRNVRPMKFRRAGGQRNGGVFGRVRVRRNG